MSNPQIHGTPFTATATGAASAQAVTTLTNVRYYITDVSGTSTTAGSWLFLGGTTGTTTFWQGIGAVSATFSQPIPAPTIGTISFLMNGATVTNANISGFYL